MLTLRQQNLLVGDFMAYRTIGIEDANQLNLVESVLADHLLDPPDYYRDEANEKEIEEGFASWDERVPLHVALTNSRFSGAFNNIRLQRLPDVDTYHVLRTGRTALRHKSERQIGTFTLGFSVEADLQATMRRNLGFTSRDVAIRLMNPASLHAHGALLERTLGVERGDHTIEQALAQSARRATAFHMSPISGHTKTRRALSDGSQDNR